ncbi:MAG: BON domain-containing protein [Candidatus Azotimanducaceae bacterium]
MIRRSKILGLVGLFLALLLGGCQAYVDGSKRTPGEVTDDTQVKVAVKLKLLDDPEVKGTRIGVSVYRGVVTLSGRVPSEYAREKAHQISAEVRGVESTVDKLTIVE